MTINAGPEYFSAEKKYLAAKSMEEKILYLEEMIRTAPHHKGSENFLAELRTRLKKFLEKQEKSKKVGKSSKKGIKKEGYQCVLIGLPNSGKSSLLARLTNAQPKISPNPFTTKEPEIGTLFHGGIKAQIVDIPSIGSELFDSGVVHTADSLIIVITSLSDLQKIEPLLIRARGKRIVTLNKSDLLDDNQKRKLGETLKSRKILGVLTSTITGEGIEDLKNLLTSNMNVIRIYCKEPGKPPTKIPVILPIGSTVKNVAESILKGFSQKVKETRLTGPSSKFSNQKVGLSHQLKDLDIVEFHTK